MAWKLSNFCQSTLSQSCIAADTTIYINAVDAAELPTLGVGDKAKAVLFNAAYTEIVNITAESSGALTVERGQENTAAREWAAGTKFVHTPTAEILQATLASLAATKFFGTGTGTNAYTVNVGAGNLLPTLADGEEVVFLIPNTSTSAAAPTLAVTDGTTTITVKNILRADGSVPDPAELKSGFVARAVYSTSLNGWLLTNLTSRDALIERINLGPIPAINQARNGMLDYWNNGTSFSTPASLTETADGWVLEYDGTIGTFTVSQQTFTLGQTDVEGGPKHFWRWAQSSAGSGSTIRRVRNDVARVNWRGGETVTVSFWAKADTNRNITLRTRQYFGSGGSPSANVDLTDVLALTTSWQKFSVTKTLGSLAGKTLGSGADDQLRFFFEFPLNVTMTIDVAALDVRPGEVAGQASDTFPLSFQRGGLNGSYDSMAEVATAIIASQADLVLVEALASSGLVYRNNTGPAWGTRSIAAGAGMGVTNGDGLSGNPTVAVTDTGLVNYMADPLSVAELASVTGNFGTAAFVNTGTSGGALGLLNANKTDSGNNTFSGTNTISGLLNLNLSDANIGSNIGTGNLGFSFDNSDYFDYNRSTNTWRVVIGATQQLVLTPSTAAFNARPTFNGATALDTGNGAQLGAANTFTADLALSSSFPQIIFVNTASTLDNKRFAIIDYAGDLIFQKQSDAGSFLSNMLTLGGAVSYFSVCDLRIEPSRTNTETNSAGYLGIPVVSGNSAYAFPREDSGKCIYHDEAGTRTYTIPSNASVPHPIGTTSVIDNTGNAGAAGAITLAITSDTLRRGDGVSGTGSRTIPANGVATIRKVAATIWVITGIFT